jgi:hypothetical protein
MCFGDTTTGKDKAEAQKDFDDDKDGEKYKNGPIAERSCTDLFMCVIFCAFLLLMVIISIIGFQKGDPYKIVTPYDAAGSICGVSEGYEDYKYLYWPRIGTGAQKVSKAAYTETICVKKCPSTSEDYAALECKTNEYVTSCTVAEENQYRGAVLFRYYCVPNLTEYKDTAYDLIDNATGGRTSKYIGDIQSCWGVLLGMSFATLLISLLYLLLLKHIAGPLTFAALIGLLLLQVAGGAMAYSASADYPTESSTHKAYKYSGIALFVLAAAYTTILLCCCNTIRRAVGIVKATSNFTKSVPEILAVPVVFFVIALLWMAFWAASAVFIYSIGEPVQRDDGLPVADIKWDKNTRYMFLIHLFGLFWVGAFIIGCSQFIIASCTVQWYFSCVGDKAGEASVLTASR